MVERSVLRPRVRRLHALHPHLPALVHLLLLRLVGGQSGGAGGGRHSAHAAAAAAAAAAGRDRHAARCRHTATTATTAAASLLLHVYVSGRRPRLRHVRLDRVRPLTGRLLCGHGWLLLLLSSSGGHVRHGVIHVGADARACCGIRAAVRGMIQSAHSDWLLCCAAMRMPTESSKKEKKKKEKKIIWTPTTNRVTITPLICF